MSSAAWGLALALAGRGPALAAGTPGDESLASHFATAPAEAPDRRELVRVVINGVDAGDQLISVSGDGQVTLPAPTVAALGMTAGVGGAMTLTPQTGVMARLDEARGRLRLDVPVALLAPRRFTTGWEGEPVRLSPEAWGAYVNYDLNGRYALSSSKSSGSLVSGGSDRLAWGGLGELRVLGPDLFGAFGWAYDSARPEGQALQRLDSTLTWRPARFSASASAGDAISTTTGANGEARPYRFGGVQIGTDHSGSPGWSSSPIASVLGTAQPQSTIDVYLNGQRTYHTETAGGAFSLILPAGTTGAGASVVVTDVTGRSLVVPVEVARVDAQLLRQGVFLWAAGVGAPRFAYGSADTRYDADVYSFVNARFGIGRRLTGSLHIEGGPRLLETELAADAAATPWLAVHASASASTSDRGSGGAGRISLIAAGPWAVRVEASAAGTFDAFDDVVSVSGRRFSEGADLAAYYSLPPESELSTRVAWQPLPRLSLSASYQRDTYHGSTPAGFAAAGISYDVAGRAPVFINLSYATGGQHSLSIVCGVSFAFGRAQASVSGGYERDGGGGGASRSGWTGSASASQALGQAPGDVGWSVFADHAVGGSFADAQAEMRTGHGVPGLAVQAFGDQVTGYATLRGSAGVVGMHPFLGDPATGGIIIADAGRPGVPVELNGYVRGRTGFDGRLAIPGAVAGIPQKVAIDLARMPIDAVPGDTVEKVVVRDGAATLASFRVRTADAAASLAVLYRGGPPPVGSTISSRTASAPISKAGRAYLSSIGRDEVLKVDMPDGARCLVRTRFDGRGGVGRRLGTLPCEDLIDARAPLPPQRKLHDRAPQVAQAGGS